LVERETLNHKDKDASSSSSFSSSKATAPGFGQLEREKLRSTTTKPSVITRRDIVEPDFEFFQEDDDGVIALFE